VADWSRGAPVLLLCVARRELLDIREGWGGGKVNATTILLESLSADDCEQLLAQLDGGVDVSPELARRILDTADGNPLFIEEMVAMVGEAGSDEVTVPPTIQALLQARLDGLAAEERAVIGRGAVEGQVFHRSAVLELAPELERLDVPTRLLSLIRKELIRPEHAQLAEEEEAFRFRHLLIRDAAYDSLPKEIRSELHERFAGWLETRGGLIEIEEIVGYHLEQAYRNLADLNPEDPRLDSLRVRAGSRLFTAAKGASRRGDLGAVTGLLERSVDLLPAGDEHLLEALVQLAWVLNNTGRSADAMQVADRLGSSEQPRWQAFAGLVASLTELYAGRFDGVRANARADEALAVFEPSGDDLGMAWAHWVRRWSAWMACRAEEAMEAVRLVASHARAADDQVLVNDLDWAMLAASYFGPGHLRDTIRIGESLLAERAGHELACANVMFMLGAAIAINGDHDRGRTMTATALAVQREAGMLVMASAGAMGRGYIEVAAGDLEAAEQILRDGLEELERLGDRAYYATAALVLADVLQQRRKYDEAASWCRVIRETTGSDDVVNILGVDALEGYLLARAGDLEGGERLTRHAAEEAAEVDFFWIRGLVFTAHGKTLALAGQRSEAVEAFETALHTYENKGHVTAAAQTRELLASIST
jgi:tetratricopeptide (TPR) repeat protein